MITFQKSTNEPMVCRLSGEKTICNPLAKTKLLNLTQPFIQKGNKHSLCFQILSTFIVDAPNSLQFASEPICSTPNIYSWFSSRSQLLPASPDHQLLPAMRFDLFDQGLSFPIHIPSATVIIYLSSVQKHHFLQHLPSPQLLKITPIPSYTSSSNLHLSAVQLVQLLSSSDNIYLQIMIVGLCKVVYINELFLTVNSNTFRTRHLYSLPLSSSVNSIDYCYPAHYFLNPASSHYSCHRVCPHNLCRLLQITIQPFQLFFQLQSDSFHSAIYIILCRYSGISSLNSYNYKMFLKYASLAQLLTPSLIIATVVHLHSNVLCQGFDVNRIVKNFNKIIEIQGTVDNHI